MSDHKFPFRWAMKKGYPAKGIDHHGLKVFGTFICGGGSSMGYKLAGYDHLGGVEIDPEMARVYNVNHSPEHLFIEDLREFNKREDLPSELYDLDILDGSPPCSSFSMSGAREKGWGVEKKFREGQTEQVLDDLVYTYIETIEKLKPKVAILENVKGLIMGAAIKYAEEIQARFTDAGYRVQGFLLNAASMGVPQKRQRVFFIGIRNDFDLPDISLHFKEPAITFGDIRRGSGTEESVFTEMDEFVWSHREISDKDFGDIRRRLDGKPSSFNSKLIHENSVVNTVASASGSKLIVYDEPRRMYVEELIDAQTFPSDYDFCGLGSKYILGMSVPPIMTAQIANQIYIQWLSKIVTA